MREATKCGTGSVGNGVDVQQGWPAINDLRWQQETKERERERDGDGKKPG